MNVEVVESVYGKDIAFDISTRTFKEASSPLYIGARLGQVKRVSDFIKMHSLNRAYSIGAWQLGELGYLTKDGKINPVMFERHDLVVFSSSDRVHKEVRPAYERLVNAVRGL